MIQERTIGRPFTADIEIYSENKYKASAEVFENSSIVTIEGVYKWAIVSGEDAKEIEMMGLVDDNHEYLVLYIEGGNKAVYRNSYVDMWRR
jgi:hypothetical protein